MYSFIKIFSGIVAELQVELKVCTQKIVICNICIYVCVDLAEFLPTLLDMLSEDDTEMQFSITTLRRTLKDNDLTNCKIDKRRAIMKSERIPTLRQE